MRVSGPAPRGTACTASNEWYYVEARQAKGFDSVFSGNANVLGGVVVHKITDGTADSSYLLDMTPATTSWTDPALVAGQTYVDPVTGVTIQATSVTATGAQVAVSYPAGACTRGAPKIAFTPTGTVWTSAGTTTTYNVSVTNQDSCGCPATTFDVSAAPPPGWTATTARTASIAPGATTSSPVSVGIAAGTMAGFYTVTLKAANVAASTLAATADSTVSIASVLTVATTVPAATYTLPKQGNAIVTVPITTTVQSSGSPLAGAAVSVVVTDPNGAPPRWPAAPGATGPRSSTSRCAPRAPRAPTTSRARRPWARSRAPAPRASSRTDLLHDEGPGLRAGPFFVPGRR